MLDRCWVMASVFVLAPVGLAAQEHNCIGSLEQQEVRGNLNVAVACELSATEVRGNVTLFAGGSLTARDLRIGGNLEARRADFVDLEGGSIGGNVRLRELVGDRSKIEGVEIAGNVALRDNRSALEILNNDVDGTLDASSNTGGLLISGNFFGGNLKCSRNRPAPTGIGNRIEGDAEGQCESLEPEPSMSPPPPPRPTTPPGSPSGGRNPPPRTPPPADTTPPTLTLLGAPSLSITIDSPYTDAGATATDSTDGDLTSRIVVVNPVNTALLGTFTITYSVSDLSGNAATPVTRTVTVEPRPAVGGGGGGGVGIEFALALLFLALRSARSSCVPASSGKAEEPLR